jgi:predicted nucleic-acid-binding Zn-ribbon protein
MTTQETMKNTFNKLVYKYRYFCDGCTKRAFYAVEKRPFTVATCKECGIELTYNENNWFDLSPEESAQVNK